MKKADEDYFNLADSAYDDLTVGNKVIGFDKKEYVIVSVLNNPAFLPLNIYRL